MKITGVIRELMIKRWVLRVVDRDGDVRAALREDDGVQIAWRLYGRLYVKGNDLWAELEASYASYIGSTCVTG